MVDSNVTQDSEIPPTKTPASTTLVSTTLGRCTIALLKVVGILPISVRGALGNSLGRIAGYIPIREKKIVTEQLALFAPKLSRGATASAVFGHIGRVTLESINLSPVLENPDLHVACKNWDELYPLLTGDRPVVVLTAHFGNWDLLAAYAIAKGIPVTTIGREARNVGLQEALRWMRDRYGVETLWRSDKAALKRLISCMREKRVVAALIDQDTRVESIFTPFFGIPTRTPSSLVELGKKFNARFLYAFLKRTPGTPAGHGDYLPSPPFELIAGELPDTASTADILSTYHAHLEKCISAHPEQWVWFHKRWRSQPDGTTLSTREYLSWLKSAQERVKSKTGGALPSFFSLLVTMFSIVGCYSSAQDGLKRAEEALREGKYEAAIAAYQSHMQRRLSLSDRPEWENPYFYELLIGDVYLTEGKIPEALTHYEIAESKGIHTSLVSDRYRSVASWYEERGELRKSFDILVKYRERDSLLFDSMLDRIGRALTAQETSDTIAAPQPATTATATPSPPPPSLESTTPVPTAQ
jgi:KDO2-lipid IV(A) lauroyltransferase